MECAKGTALLLLLLLCACNADIYMHSMRGSNNRLDEAGRARQNANRMFDSQNNERGGYNVGSLYFYEGSIVNLEWTAQHSCGPHAKAGCQMILQYTCEDQTPGLRDGTTTTTIPENKEESAQIEYGQQETFRYFWQCRNRKRNEGLFTADQNLNRGPNPNSARHTRQNPNGQRYAFECPEERDYYPYWHPTPWKDIAIFTDETSRCEYYRAESENVKGRGYCSASMYNNQADCIEAGANWRTSIPYGSGPPDCLPAPWSRDNHLGNDYLDMTTEVGADGTVNGEVPSARNAYAMSYNWTVPSHASGKCALRIRYNISAAELPWDTDSTSNTKAGDPNPLVIATYKNGTGDVYLRNNPQVDFGVGFNLQLAINTAQIGRVFQDRSHVFEVYPRPADMEPGSKLYNLNVRGKRGNIVQVYPGVEYDFHPNRMEVHPQDYVHIHWTGSNTNPNNNDGQGKRGTDRSNMVEINRFGDNYPKWINNQTMFRDAATAMRMALLDSPQKGGETSELDDAGTYFDGGIHQFRRTTDSSTAVYHYMSTRNNNFSNRSQKGSITVLGLPRAAAAGAVAATVVGGAAVGAAAMIVLFRKRKIKVPSVLDKKAPRLAKFLRGDTSLSIRRSSKRSSASLKKQSGFELSNNSLTPRATASATIVDSSATSTGLER